MANYPNILDPTYIPIMDLIYEKFGNNKKISIVDYGCGCGHFLEIFPNNRIKRYMGFDVNKESINAAKKKFNKSKIITFNKIKKNKSISFGKSSSIDLVVLIGVLQYLNDSEINYLLNETKKVLNKHGGIVISCVSDRAFYKYTNLYSLVFATRYLQKKYLINKIENSGFTVKYTKETGMLLTPLFSNILVIPFDLIDKLVIRTKGELGIFGKTIRRITLPILRAECNLPIDYGFTIILSAEKN